MTDQTSPLERMNRRQWEKDNPKKIRKSKREWALRNPEKIKAKNRRRIRFGDKQIYLDKNPRTGICSKCGKVGNTILHHKEYHPLDPLANTIELCRSCHMKKHIQQGDIIVS